MYSSKKILLNLSAIFFTGTVIFTACKKDGDLDIAPYDASEEMAGGETTSFDFSVNAFGHPATNLTAEQKADFVVGNSFFKLNWVTAPASTTDRDGLGPLFNAASCSACHNKDGRGKPPVDNNEALLGLLVRLSVSGVGTHNSPLAHPAYGGQFNGKAILGVDAEGDVTINYEEIAGKYADGNTYSIRKPHYSFSNLKYGSISDALFSPRVAPQMVGMGLLEAIDENTILALADENDANGDGVSGRPNYVWDAVNQTVSLGRLGWKANQPGVKQQTAGAFLGDMGITTSLFPEQDLSESQKELYDNLSNGGSPEIEDGLLNKVVLYTASLAVPARRNPQDKTILRGKKLFSQAKCDACHIPKIQTGNTASIEAFRNQTIFPYTDLLLHDMGDDLADGRPDFMANGNEWRTPPLWGIGLIQTVNGHSFLMHDGRARNIEEAILWHGGEGENAKKAFTNLSKEDRQALISFVNSL